MKNYFTNLKDEITINISRLWAIRILFSNLRRLILTRLDAVNSPEQMNQPGYDFHSLKGNYKGYYAVKVSGNWRIIFRFENENAYDVDYLDYH